METFKTVKQSAIEFYLKHQGYKAGTKRHAKYEQLLNEHTAETVIRMATERGYLATK